MDGGKCVEWKMYRAIHNTPIFSNKNSQLFLNKIDNAWAVKHMPARLGDIKCNT